jgi:mannose-6-phosphate isomerase-like protein (cupin superfamily)
MPTQAFSEPQIARFADLKPFGRAFLDSYIPSYEKENFRVIGSGVFEDPAARPVIGGNHGFSVGYIRCQPGKGAALHSHETLEVFIPMNGKMTVTYGQKGEHVVTLEEWDTISIPVGVMRGFSNPNSYPLVIMGLVQDGRDGPERVSWHQDVVNEAATAGVRLDGHGNLLVEQA